jgi:hypothetical protein
LGISGSGNRLALIDFTGDDTYTDHGLRIIRNNGGANTSSEFDHRGTGDFVFKAIEAAQINFYTTNTSRMTISSGGAVTITQFVGGGTTTASIDNNGTIIRTSDSRLKTEVKDAKIPGLKEVLQIKPRAYKWLRDIKERGKNAATEIGFFADEVNPIIPSAAPMGSDGYYGFYDRSVIAALVKSVQELNNQNEDLRRALCEKENICH